MTIYEPSSDREGVGALVGRLADGFSKLVSHHLALARMELTQDAKALATEAGKVVAFVPFVLTGYLLLCAALGVLLGRWLGLSFGLAVVGGVNLVGGAAGIWVALSRMQSRPVLQGTLQEVQRTAEALAVPADGARRLEAAHGHERGA